MGKSTISMVIFNSYFDICNQRVPIKGPRFTTNSLRAVVAATTGSQCQDQLVAAHPGIHASFFGASSNLIPWIPMSGPGHWLMNFLSEITLLESSKFEGPTMTMWAWCEVGKSSKTFYIKQTKTSEQHQGCLKIYQSIHCIILIIPLENHYF